MKNRVLILVVGLAIVALFAVSCKKTETTETTDTVVTDSSTTSVSSTDTSGTTSTVDTSGTTGTATNAGSTPMTAEDHEFINKAAVGGLAEVEMGTVASTRATNADVKNFGQRMVTDHGKANDELKQLASTKGMTLPTETDAEHKKKADEISKQQGAKFDKAYMSDMVKDHDKDVKEFEEAQNKVKDPDLKSWIQKTLPVLKDHQKMAHDINGKLK